MSNEQDRPIQEGKMCTWSVRLDNRKVAIRLSRAMAMAVLLVAGSAPSALAQYDSGSSGVHGVFPPAPLPSGTRHLLWDLKTGIVRFCSTYDTTIVPRPDACANEIGTAQIPGIPPGGLATGVFEFSTFDVSVAPGQTSLDIFPVGYQGATPVTILSQGAVRLRANVALRIDGQNGASTSSGLQPTGYGASGGRPGPGGFAGGAGGRQGSPSTNGSAGFGPTGGAGGLANVNNNNGQGANATATPVATSLVPLVGGSGGGGGGAFDTLCSFRGAGAGGGGGGGAILISASTQITLDSSSRIDARPGTGGAGCSVWRGGNGSGGSVRLVAATITGHGPVQVGSGTGAGVVRFEGDTSGYTGFVDTTRGTVLSAAQPAIPTDFPVLRITSVGGIAVGQNPSGSLSTPDVTFTTAPTAPVNVDLAASNIPVGTVTSLRASPLVGAATAASSSPLSGTAQASTATASLQIPAGAGVITATTSFPVTPSLTRLLPSVPGFTPDSIQVVADATGTSRVFMIGTEARRVELRWGTDGRFALVP